MSEFSCDPPTSWLLHDLSHFDGRVACLVPPRYESYARVLHPWFRPTDGGLDTVPSWTARAHRRGLPIAAGTQHHELLLPEEREDHDSAVPLSGTLTEELTGTLARLLASHTTTPDRCFYAVWDGYGWIQGGEAVAELSPSGSSDPVPPRAPLAGTSAVYLGSFSLAQRRYVLFCGSWTHAANIAPPGEHQSPNLWWPEDRSWFVSTDVDLHSTYIGGSKEAISDVLRSDVEAIPVAPLDCVVDSTFVGYSGEPTGRMSGPLQRLKAFNRFLRLRR